MKDMGVNGYLTAMSMARKYKRERRKKRRRKEIEEAEEEEETEEKIERTAEIKNGTKKNTRF